MNNFIRRIERRQAARRDAKIAEQDAEITRLQRMLAEKHVQSD